MRVPGLFAFALGLSATASTAWSRKAENVEFPLSYKTVFVRYSSLDKPDRTPPIVRFFYVDEAALAAADAGAPLPDGAVVVMEDHEAERATDGTPVTDANGRFVPTGELTNIVVQEKREGWGRAVDASLRNGDWLYAWFAPDGSRKTGRDGTLDACYGCHLDAAATDYTFTTRPFVDRIKGGD